MVGSRRPAGPPRPPRPAPPRAAASRPGRDPTMVGQSGPPRTSSTEPASAGASAPASTPVSIPTVILFKDGQPVETMVGAMPKVAYEQRIKKYVDRAVN